MAQYPEPLDGEELQVEEWGKERAEKIERVRSELGRISVKVICDGYYADGPIRQMLKLMQQIIELIE